MAAVEQLVKDGTLDKDERAHDGRRMVTRESLAEAHGAHRDGPCGGVRSGDDLLSWAEVEAMTGLSSSEIDALVADGTLVREQHQRRRHVTRVSVLRYLVEHDPGRLLIAGA